MNIKIKKKALKTLNKNQSLALEATPKVAAAGTHRTANVCWLSMHDGKVQCA
ncbi:hypothetical protein L1077_26465 [Pseudoalteromonas luteoviolacea]|uniref:hypothetical protein n=1 Tax=Pseudoalteromonas luteoviolacea TaxID=43657 RepID=UPI001F196768|nr:hypothetical protein [Pseudoalteromonas luteoviolacea]MCF6442972.1 hypothetical protein [Pseudoalteromonas luteoviolacea]